VPDQREKEDIRDLLIRIASRLAKGRRVPPDVRKLITDKGVPKLIAANTSEVQKVIRASPEAGPNTLRDLNNLLEWVFRLGVMAREFQLVQQKRERSAPARVARRNKSERRREIIVRIAGPILKEYPTYTSNRIGIVIAPMVNNELANVGLDPITPDAIGRIVDKHRKNEQSSD
jgi:hypothetical protein